MAVYFEPYLQRKRSEEYDKERYYEQQNINRENLRNIGANIANVMFSYHERHKAEMKEKFNALTTLGGMFGFDKLPQSALDSFGNSIDAMAGERVYPRGPDGHAVAPSPNVEEMTKRYLEGLPKPELDKRLDVLAGFTKPDDPAKAVDMAARRRHEEVMEGYAAMRTKYSADAAYARVAAADKRNAARDPGRPSNMVIDNETQTPRFAREGEAQLTQQQYENYLKGHKMTSEIAIKKTALKKEIEYLREKIRTGTDQRSKAAQKIVAQGLDYIKSKDPKLVKAGKMMVADAYGKYGEAEGLTSATTEAIAEALDTKERSWSDWLPSLDWTRGGDSKPVEASPNPTDLTGDEDLFLKERGF